MVVGVVRREHDRRVPVPAIAAARRVPPAAGSSCARSVTPIDADDVAVLRLGVDDARIVGIDLRLEAVAALNLEPVVVADARAAAHRARAAPRVVVLQAAADVVRRLHVVGDVVELAEVHVVDRPPTSAPLSQLMPTPPSLPSMMWFGLAGLIHIAWWSECIAPLSMNVLPPSSEMWSCDAEHVDAQVVGRVDADLAEVHRPRVDVATSSATSARHRRSDRCRSPSACSMRA